MDLVTVATFRDPHEAHMARTLLESFEIEAWVAHENHIGVNWMISNAVGGVKLQVADSDEAAAREVLEAEGLDDFEPPPEPRAELPPESRCPRCANAEIEPTRTALRTKAVSLWIGLPFVLQRDYWRCTACGHEWRRKLEHRGPLSVLANTVALSLLLAVYLVSLPLRVVRAIARLRDLREYRYACWRCGATFYSGTRHCPDCHVVFPDERALRELVEPERDYDRFCLACRTPYHLADYRADEGAPRCSHCRSELSVSGRAKDDPLAESELR